MSREVETMSSSACAALCGGVVDYAGVFPPAQLDLADAVERYARYRSGTDAWMLNRFIISARDLSAFEVEASRHEADWRWPLSVVCGRAEDAERAGAWRSELATVESLEAKASTPLPELDCEVFVEHPLRVSREELELLGKRNAMLKIRLGGESTPTSSAVARILFLCAELGIPLKATAGLHQALRSESHGFLNLLLAATLARRGGQLDTIRALVDETDATALGFDADCVTWRGHRFDVDAIADARHLLRSFGSCSFDEPLESLAALGFRSR